ncbi:MAG: PEGA domain-containing protein, partial [Candidatus Marinimicrobia bacterium]|nr:PEGA domain-containing protein [Candidatus Neomarinimicrobiota bacterium]
TPQLPESGIDTATSVPSPAPIITLESKQDADELATDLHEAASVDSISLSTDGEAHYTSAKLNPGRLYLIANPWATIWIDSLKVGVTPLPEPISITTGQHTVQFMHPNYPDITKQIWVEAGQADTLSMNWSAELGFLQLTVHPWAKVYVDSKSYDTTPIHQAIPLQPGEFQLLLTNPNYPPWNQYLHVGAGDTLRVNVRLRKSEGL